MRVINTARTWIPYTFSRPRGVVHISQVWRKIESERVWARTTRHIFGTKFIYREKAILFILWSRSLSFFLDTYDSIFFRI